MEPLLVQHRKHYTKESFQISPMDPEVDIFLPFSWIMKHPPQGAWMNQKVRFNSARCLEKYTKHETGGLSLTWDESVAIDLAAHLVGYVSVVTEDREPLKIVPKEFHQYLKIMGKETADVF